MAGGLSRTGTGTSIPQGPAAALLSPPAIPRSSLGGSWQSPGGAVPAVPAGVRARRLQRETWLRGRRFPRAARWDSPSPPRRRLRSPRATTDTRTHRQMAGGWPAAGTCVFRRVSDGEGLPRGVWGGWGKERTPVRTCVLRARVRIGGKVCPRVLVCTRVCALWVGICRCGHMRCACGCAKCAYVCLRAPYVCVVGQARVCTPVRTRVVCVHSGLYVCVHIRVHVCCVRRSGWALCQGLSPCHPRALRWDAAVSPPSPCPMQVLQAGRGKAATLGSCPHAAGAPVGAAAVPPMAELVTLCRVHLWGPILR